MTDSTGLKPDGLPHADTCQRCRRALDYDPAAGAWVHPLSNLPWDHSPIPVQVEYVSTIEEQCDFCPSTVVDWTIPATPFEVAHGHRTVGDWSACNACGELIHAGKWGSLAPRATKLWPRGESTYKEAAQAVRALGAALREHMTAEPYRIER